jgi:Putative Actinobacterial Holin-X, holin superfamily III
MDDNPTGAGATSSSARFERAEDRPIGELVRDLSQQTSTLVRQELELARAEITQKGKIAGVGAGMFGAAGLLGFFAFGALTTAIIAALALVFDEVWPAALIVAAVYGAIAGVLALTGKNKVQEATPPVERAQESVKQDIASVKAHAQAGRDHGHA